MDAVDLNWCLACGHHIDTEGTSPYCSQSCLVSDRPSTSALPSYPTVSSFVDRDSILDEDDDYHCDGCSADPRPALPASNSWIGRGEAGIRAWAQAIPQGAPCDWEETSSTSGTLKKPKLLLQPRHPVKPSLCMSRAQPAPPQPSRPILTPQQSLPSVSRDSAASIPSGSMLSLTTGSSSFSVATPATASEVGSLRDAPVPRSQQVNFLGGLKAQLRAWAASSTAQKEAPRSSTLTRKDNVYIVEGSDSESFDDPAPHKVRRARSPAPFFHMPEQYQATRKESTKDGRRTMTEDHPAYLTRGRKSSRISS